jgi:membrane associated rhomboid family serine protease
MTLTRVATLFVRDNPLRQEFKTAFAQYRASGAPVTLTLIWIVTTVFAAEVALTVLFGVRSIRVFATGSFKLYPELAWLFAPVLHAGLGHFLVNIGGLLTVGIPLELQFTNRRFGIFLLATAYFSTVGGLVAKAVFTTTPIAVYGISGTVFALAGYALIHFGRSSEHLKAFEWVALLVGFAAATTVAVDFFTGPYLHPEWINGGHATGFMIGVLVGEWRYGCPEITEI